MIQPLPVSTTDSMRPLFRLAVIMLLSVGGCAGPIAEVTSLERSRGKTEPTTRPSADGVSTSDEEDDENLAQAVGRIESVLGIKGQMDGPDVYVVRVPRPDLYVTIEGMEVPTGAGIYTEFRFYYCPCGKVNVIGQFVTADYEANDVVASLQESRITVASLGPFLLHEHPRLMAVRFHGEGRSRKLAGQLKKALEWTGEQRMAPQKLPE